MNFMEANRMIESRNIYILPSINPFKVINMPKGIYEKSEEHKKKISKTLKGVKKSEEFKEQLRGRTLSKETRKKMSEAQKGHIVTEETKEKIRQANYKKRNPNNRSITEAHNILEKKLYRELLKTEVAHHIDGDYTNNNPENLKEMDYIEHNRMHGIRQWVGKKKLSLSDIKFIVKHKEINYRLLAKKFDICPTYIYEIRRRFDENGFLKCR